MNELKVGFQEVLGEEVTKKCFYPDRSNYNALIFKCPSAEDMSKVRSSEEQRGASRSEAAARAEEVAFSKFCCGF